MLGEGGGVVGLGEKPEDGEADSSGGVLGLLVFGNLREGGAWPGSLGVVGGLRCFGGSGLRGASACGFGWWAVCGSSGAGVAVSAAAAVGLARESG